MGASRRLGISGSSGSGCNVISGSSGSGCNVISGCNGNGNSGGGR